MTLRTLRPHALKLARERWNGAKLRAISAHALTPDGNVTGEGMWFFLFATEEGARAVVHDQNGWTHLETPPVPEKLVPERDLDGVEIADSNTLVQHYCGLAGWDGVLGRAEDSLWIGQRDGKLVAVVIGKGGATAALDAVEPQRVIFMDFEPIRLPGDVV